MLYCIRFGFRRPWHACSQSDAVLQPRTARCATIACGHSRLLLLSRCDGRPHVVCTGAVCAQGDWQRASPAPRPPLFRTEAGAPGRGLFVTALVGGPARDTNGNVLAGPPSLPRVASVSPRPFDALPRTGHQTSAAEAKPSSGWRPRARVSPRLGASRRGWARLRFEGHPPGRPRWDRSRRQQRIPCTRTLGSAPHDHVARGVGAMA